MVRVDGLGDLEGWVGEGYDGGGDADGEGEGLVDY